MCGRYQLLYEPLTTDPPLSSALRSAISARASGEVFPSDPILVFYPKDGRLQAFCGRWGFRMKERRVINARLETLQERPLFRPYAHHRCVLPCNCYYEWKNGDSGKQRMRIAHPQTDRLYLAAIYNEQMEVCVLTMEAQGHLASIHDRMPIVLDESGMRAYLRGEQGVRTLNARLVARPADPAI